MHKINGLSILIYFFYEIFKNISFRKPLPNKIYQEFGRLLFAFVEKIGFILKGLDSNFACSNSSQPIVWTRLDRTKLYLKLGTTATFSIESKERLLCRILRKKVFGNVLNVKLKIAYFF